MNKLEFNKLTINEQLDYINKLLLSGQSVRSIAKDLEIGKTTIANRFIKAGYSYNDDIKAYERVNTEVMQTVKEDIKTSQDSQEIATEGITKEVIKETSKEVKQDSTQYTIEAPTKYEPFNNRLVANVTKAQKDYVRTTSKKFENESSFVRFMIDYFRREIQIK